MTSSDKNFYITTAISYVNGSPHLGHAYEAILTDVMARYKRLDGYNTHFLTGTDEHGQKVAKTAEAAGKDPKEFCDQIAAEFVTMDKDLGLSNDDFIRTTEERHYKASKAIWQAIAENNPDDIYLSQYEGWYSVRDEAYFGESELTTEGDQKLAPTGAPVEWVEEPSYFFRLSAYTDKLLEYYEAHPEFILPEARRNEVISFVKGGLQDISISRTNFKWGVPVPGNEDHVMYVWLDALTNYITGVGYPETGSEQFQNFWPADFHVIGKDIIRFHCVYWPAFLMAAGVDLPKHVFAHGFINVDGQKMSKSVGNVVAPQDLLDNYGLDATRYILMREVPHGQDGNFSHEHAVSRINSDLANGLGNLAQRTLSMIYKNCDGKIPTPQAYTAVESDLLDEAHHTLLENLRDEFDSFRFNRGLESLFKFVDKANAYIDEAAPWKLKKTDPEKMGSVLYILAEMIRCIAIAIQPVIPDSAGKVLDQLAIPEDNRDYSFIAADKMLRAETEIPEPQGVFPRIQLEEEEAA